MLDRFAVLVARLEIPGQLEIVDEHRFALQAVGLLATDRQSARRPCVPRDFGRDARFLPRLLDQRCAHRVGAARARALGRDAAADEIVEPIGIDRLLGAAPREPQRKRAVAAAHVAVRVRGVRANAEIARRRALEQEQRRRAELRHDGVALVAPCGEQTFALELARDAPHRIAAHRRGAQARRESDAARVRNEDVGEARDPRRALVVEAADGDAVDHQRAITLCRRRELGA